MTLKIGILNGDDIGREIVPAAVEVVRAAAKRHQLLIDWIPLPIGRTALDTHGSTMPDGTLEALARLDGWILGPIGHRDYRWPTRSTRTRSFESTSTSSRMSARHAMAPGLCIGEGAVAMAQATHGSAPDIAGKGIANPYAMIESSRMLIEWLGRDRGIPQAVDAAATMQRAIRSAMADASCRTPDIRGTASTQGMTDAIIAQCGQIDAMANMGLARAPA